MAANLIFLANSFKFLPKHEIIELSIDYFPQTFFPFFSGM